MKRSIAMLALAAVAAATLAAPASAAPNRPSLEITEACVVSGDFRVSIAWDHQTPPNDVYLDVVLSGRKVDQLVSSLDHFSTISASGATVALIDGSGVGDRDVWNRVDLEHRQAADPGADPDLEGRVRTVRQPKGGWGSC